MKSLSLIIVVLLILASCHTPGKYPLPLKHQALDDMESFRTYFLEGRLCDAGMSLDQAIDIYAKIDDMCSISDAYIQQYLFYAYINNKKHDVLKKAEEFAHIGNCSIEKKWIDSIQKDHVISEADPGSAPNDIYRSIILRKAAFDKQDIKLIKDALIIDRKNSWTIFIVHDLMILKTLTDNEGEKDKIQKRIDFISGYIQECY